MQQIYVSVAAGTRRGPHQPRLRLQLAAWGSTVDSFLLSSFAIQIISNSAAKMGLQVALENVIFESKPWIPGFSQNSIQNQNSAAFGGAHRWWALETLESMPLFTICHFLEQFGSSF